MKQQWRHSVNKNFVICSPVLEGKLDRRAPTIVRLNLANGVESKFAAPTRLKGPAPPRTLLVAVLYARSLFVKYLLFRSVLFRCAANFLPGPFGSPLDCIIGDPVVRLALKTPVAYGRTKRNSLSVKDKLPVGGREWGDDLTATSTGTFVNGGSIFNRDINYPVFKFFGYAGNKSML